MSNSPTTTELKQQLHRCSISTLTSSMCRSQGISSDTCPFNNATSVSTTTRSCHSPYLTATHNLHRKELPYDLCKIWTCRSHRSACNLCKRFCCIPRTAAKQNYILPLHTQCIRTGAAQSKNCTLVWQADSKKCTGLHTQSSRQNLDHRCPC